MGSAVEDFFFAPVSTAPLALLRMLFGLVVFFWTLALAPDLNSMFSSDGLNANGIPWDVGGRWSLFDLSQSSTVVTIAFVVLLGASLAFTVGLFTRVAAIVVFLGVVSFTRRQWYAFNSGDDLVRIVSLFLVFAPAGAALSVDRWRSARAQFWDFPQRAPWALRLVQIQISALYLSTVWQKVRGVTWNDGTAAAYAFRIEDLERFPMPSVLSSSELLANLATYGTLTVELSLGILLWSRAMRPIMIPLGIAFHLSIDYSVRVGFFSWAIIACYMAFVPGDAAERAILALRDRLGRRPAAVPLRRRVRQSST